ncbi:MAG: hypothetical protein WC415_01965 [Patescibacteria group bacterium]
MHPKVKFKIDYKKDIKTLQAFTADAAFDDGRNLLWAVFKHYSQLKKYFSDNKISNNDALVKFIKKQYFINSELMNKNLKIFATNWKKIEPNFFNLINDLFGDFSWPKGEYTAYFTIWSMYPRFLEDKTFQVPYKFRSRKYINVIIAHEMLHFIFYEYFYSLFKKYRPEKYNFFVWNVSEIFNVIVQNSPSWLKVFGVPTMSYPEHDKIVKKINKSFVLNGKEDIKDLILKIVEEVQKM